MKSKITILALLMITLSGCTAQPTTAAVNGATTLPFTANYIDTWEDNKVYELEWTQKGLGQCETLLLDTNMEGIDSTTCIEWSVE